VAARVSGDPEDCSCLSVVGGQCMEYRDNCCEPVSMGCGCHVTSTTTTTTTEKSFDCSAGYARWEKGWSDDKKAYCESKLDKTDDEKKRLEQSLADLEKSMENDKESIASRASDIKALIAGVKALDKSVQEATETRKDENSEYKATMAANKAAKELIGLAKNRMMKFYNPDLYVAPKKQELSAEQRIAVNMGSEAAPTTTPSGVAGTGITYFVQVSLTRILLAMRLRLLLPRLGEPTRRRDRSRAELLR